MPRNKHVFATLHGKHKRPLPICWTTSTSEIPKAKNR